MNKYKNCTIEREAHEFFNVPILDPSPEKLAGIKYALENQIGWQKYAEAKNILMATLSITTITALFRFENLENWLQITQIGFFIFLFTTILSFAFSISTVMIKIKSFHGSNSISPWRMMVMKTPKNFGELISSYNSSTQIQDLMYSHYIGSKITYTKYRWFNVAAVAYLIGVLSFLTVYTYQLFYNCNLVKIG